MCPGSRSPFPRYLDTALALIEQSVQPKATGINMCGGVTPATNNYALNMGNFPWSQKFASSVSDTSNFALNATNGPCTGAYTSAPTSIDLTPVTFVGPSPYSKFANVWETNAGVAVYSYNGTVERIFDSKGIYPGSNAPVTGMVTLDQFRNYKPCQQAPCNQAACNSAPCSLQGGTSTAYMG